MSNNGMLWCESHNTDCLYMNYGTCKASRCNVEDVDYVEKEKRKEQRLQELHGANAAHQTEEKEAATLIRRQVKTKVDILQDEVNYKRKQMERFYTRGMTRLGDKASQELAELERKLEKSK